MHVGGVVPIVVRMLDGVLRQAYGDILSRFLGLSLFMGFRAKRASFRYFNCFLAITAVTWLAVFAYTDNRLHAQVNTEQFRKSHNSEGYRVSLGTDFSLLSGNSQKFEIAPNARLDYVSNYWDWFLIGTYKHGESGDAVFANKGFLHWRLTAPVNLHEVLWEFFVQREFDDFRQITDRTLVGLGLRVPVLGGGERTHAEGLFWGSGLMTEHEAYAAASAVDRVRWTNYLSGKYVQKSVTWAMIVYVQPDVRDFGDMRALADTSLSMMITEQLSWRCTLKWMYSSRPQNGVSPHDVELQNGVVWTM